LRSTNPRINWQNLTLHFDRQAPEPLEPILFDVTAPASAVDHPHTPPQLRSNGATGTFVSDQLDLSHDPLDRPMELQLFDGKPTTAGPITKSHTSSITLDNGLQFPVQLLVTQLPEVTPIILGLPWLRDVNPDIDWKDLTMKFPGTGTCLAAISLRLQPTSNPSEAGATGEPTAPPDKPCDYFDIIGGAGTGG
ncbi:hypothetical protein C0993_009603, partial [Termitomyces sp. T159_Od127]